MPASRSPAPTPKRARVDGADAPRAWQRMLSGRRLDLIDPSPLDVEIEDIAHGLARVARWNGQTRGDDAFSVAQHSLTVEAVCGRLAPDWPAKWRLVALLHDAPEYVVGDMISPFKAVIGDDYKRVEKRLERAIHLRFGLPAETPAAVKKTIKAADHVSAWFEATRLAGFSQGEADAFFGPPPPGLDLDVAPLNPRAAQAQFLARFQVLLAAADAETAGR